MALLTCFFLSRLFCESCTVRSSVKAETRPNGQFSRQGVRGDGLYIGSCAERKSTKSAGRQQRQAFRRRTTRCPMNDERDGEVAVIDSSVDIYQRSRRHSTSFGTKSWRGFTRKLGRSRPPHAPPPLPRPMHRPRDAGVHEACRNASFTASEHVCMKRARSYKRPDGRVPLNKTVQHRLSRSTQEQRPKKAAPPARLWGAWIKVFSQGSLPTRVRAPQYERGEVYTSYRVSPERKRRETSSEINPLSIVSKSRSTRTLPPGRKMQHAHSTLIPPRPENWDEAFAPKKC